MKKLLAVLVFVLFGTVTFAQWSGVNPNITTDPLWVNAKVGVNKVPAATFDIFNPIGGCTVVAARNYTGAADATIGSYTLRNDATQDRFQFLFRKFGGQHEVLQTSFSSTTNSFREFSYFNMVTGKFEMRAGVTNVEYLNLGNILLNNTGAVGIGLGATPIPSGAKLAVAGKIACKEVEVTLTGFPDFVFNKDYKLMSLSEVENFVNENKHLPNVPSEKEVLENGLNIGDMNATLLQKVEELTLYMINLQKENDALKARVANLEK